MADIIDFKKKEEKVPAHHMFTLVMYEDSTGHFEVELEIEDAYEDFEIYVAMQAAAAKFAVDHGLAVYEDEADLTIH